MNADKPKLILWSPALLDHFIVVSSSIRLYQSTAAAREHLQQSHDLATAGSGHPDKQQGQPRSPPLVAASPSPSPSPSPFRLLDTVSYPQHSIRAVAWTTSASDPLLVAAGLLSGKLALIRFREEVRVVKEFDPRYQRACHAVAWSAHWEERVAVGLDRVRNSPGTLVWDIHSKGRAAAASQPQQQQAAAAAASPFPSSLSSSLTMSIAHHQSPTECVTEALLGVSNSEASLSLAWWPLHPACLAVGTGFKWLRLYDIRQPSSLKPQSVVAHSKSVFGCKYDPSCGHRLCTYSEDGVVRLWDHRSLTAPVLSILSSGWKGSRPRPLIELEWCPSSPGLLSSISREEDIVRLWDVSGSVPSTAEEVALAAAAADVPCCPPFRTLRAAAGSGFLSALSWHPRHRQRLLMVSREGMVEERGLHDDVLAVWSARGELCMGLDASVSVQLQDDPQLAADVGASMRQRAVQGYSLDVERNRAVSRSRGEDELERVWEWLAQAEGRKAAAVGGREGAEAGAAAAGLYDGVMAALLPPEELHRFRRDAQLSSAASHSAAPPAAAYESVLINTSASTPPSHVYLSPGRLSALHSCGWFDTFTPASSTATARRSTAGRGLAAVNMETSLRQLEERGQYERAAMLAVFHLDLRRALSSLTLGASASASPSSSQDLGLVALALAGYQSAQSGSSLWSRTFSATLQHKPGVSADLKAIFSFLSAPHPARQSLHTFHALLSSASSSPPLLSFRDRLAFACRFLPDSDLFAYVRQQAEQSVRAGELEGLLLTGLTAGNGGEELMQHYLDGTGDVQTVALLGCYGMLAQAEEDGRAGGGAAAGSLRPERWLAAYRQLCNQWRLWRERAQLDVQRALLYAQHAHAPSGPVRTAAQRPPAALAAAPASSSSSASSSLASSLLPPVSAHVHARCSFCSQSLHFDNMVSRPAAGRGASMAARRRLEPAGAASGGSGAAAAGEPGSVRVRGCPHCKKSLPRCALCMVALDAAMPTGAAQHARGKQAAGGGGGSRAGGPAARDDSGAVSAAASLSVSALGGAGIDGSSACALSSWFSWCQQCRHGGHAEHLQDWFRQHEQCPVHDCSCRCRSRD